MSNQTLSVINKAIMTKEKYDIITFPTHERLESDLCKTGHNFYAFSGDNMKTWNPSYAPVPDNYHVLPKDSIMQGIDYDFIFANSKFGHLQMAYNISRAWNIPIVSMECTVPTPNMTNDHVNQMRQLTGDINVFLTEYSKKQWDIKKESTVITHGINTDIFKPSKDITQKPYALSVVNDYVNRDYCCNYSGWQRITKDIETKLVGNTEGLSKPAGSIEELVKEYQAAQIFLNTSTFSPVPTSLLEAMACGCAVVTTATCEIPEIIEHGKNAFMSNDEEELTGFINELIKDEELRQRVGQAARDTILEKYSMDVFLKNWNTLFARAYAKKG